MNRLLSAALAAFCVLAAPAAAPAPAKPGPYARFLAADYAARHVLMTNQEFRAEAAQEGTPPPGAFPFQPRWQRAAKNLRDLGGWKTEDGRRIRFGRLYRSAVHPRAKDKPPAPRFARLGVRTELDLRDPAKDAAPFGTNMVYVTLGQSAPAYEGVFSEKARPLVRKMFDVLLDEANYPVVFHCSQGADRTGTLAALVELLMGVSEDDVSKDWQLTIFHNPNPKFRDAERYDRFIARLASYPGADYRAKTEAFLRTCGLADAEFAKLRDLLLEKPGMSFGFVSDTHVTGELSRGRGKGRGNGGFPKALDWFRRTGVDAVVNAGDLTEGGNLEEVGLYADMFRAAFPSNAPAHFCVWGNHDVLDASYMRNMDLSAECAQSIPSNHVAVCQRLDGVAHAPGTAWSRQIGGVWFVGVDWKGEAAALPVLEEVAAKAAGRPFFFVQHNPGASAELKAFLRLHPNCVKLGGHNHMRLDRPEAVPVRGGGTRVELLGGSTDAHASIVRVWPDGVTVERRDLRTGRDLPDLAFDPAVAPSAVARGF